MTYPVYTYSYRPIFLGLASTITEAQAIWAADWRSPMSGQDDESERLLAEKIASMTLLPWSMLDTTDEQFDEANLGGDVYEKYFTVDA